MPNPEGLKLLKLILEAIDRFRTKSIDNYRHGPYEVLLDRRYSSLLDEDYTFFIAETEVRTKTVRKRVLEIEQVNKITLCDVPNSSGVDLHPMWKE
jgi:hypothetical protein